MMQGIPGMQQGGSSLPSRPLFPSASAVTSASATSISTPIGADFKPISSTAGSGPTVRPTFPAYSNEGANASSSDSKVNFIVTTSATSKIIHPAEDLSLVKYPKIVKIILNNEIQKKHHFWCSIVLLIQIKKLEILSKNLFHI